MNRQLEKKVTSLSEEFIKAQKILTALGDENRQHLIIEMMHMGDCNGVRVGEITEKTHLSRPAVSHHLQILKDAGILKVRKEGTMNYYYFDPDTKSLDRLIHILNQTKEIMVSLPDRSGEHD
jgi:DNA-binding transcriptional ArsR family regulator